MNDAPSNSTGGVFNQVPLRTVLGVIAIACILLAITRPSVPASIMVVVAIFFAIGSIFIRRIRGEVIVLLMIGVVAPGKASAGIRPGPLHTQTNQRGAADSVFAGLGDG